MPSITLSKEELLKDIGKPVDDEQLAERISMLGTDLESIDGDDINVEIFPNRPDLLSQQGFNRAMASFLGTKPGLKKYKTKKGDVKVTVKKSTEDCRPYTSCAVIRRLNITADKLEEIIQIQEKLHVTFGRNRKRVAIGLYPLEHITLPITFAGLAPNKIKFTPLDGKEMSAKQILEEHEKGKEFAHLVLPLKHYACFIDGANNIMSLTPVINSNHVGKVTTKTTDVFLECSGFDFRTVNECTTMIACALADMGGDIETVEVTYEHGILGTIRTPNLEPKKWVLDENYINRILGLELKTQDFKELLKKMGYSYNEKEVLVPAYRTDILHQADFAEDIAIAYGYENFTPSIPRTSTVGERTYQTTLQEQLREILVGHGLIEMKNYHLVNRKLQELIEKKDIVRLKSSVSKEHDTLRHDILVSLLGAATRNTSAEYPQRTFEIGRVFRKDGEENQLAILLLGEEENYTSARQIADSIFAATGCEGTYEEHDEDWLLPGRAAKFMIKNTHAATIGELHPRILAALEIEMPASVVVMKVI